MRKAFTSSGFEADQDAFRYLASANRRLYQLNELIRRCRYGGNIPTPFMPGERALFRAPVVVEVSILFANNEEATVLAMDRSTLGHEIGEASGVPKWTATIQTWLIRLRDADGNEKMVHLSADDAAFQKVISRTKDEDAESVDSVEASARFPVDRCPPSIALRNDGAHGPGKYASNHL
jgi:hypothetical protein